MARQLCDGICYWLSAAWNTNPRLLLSNVTERRKRACGPLRCRTVTEKIVCYFFRERKYACGACNALRLVGNRTLCIIQVSRVPADGWDDIHVPRFSLHPQRLIGFLHYYFWDKQFNYFANNRRHWLMSSCSCHVRENMQKRNALAHPRDNKRTDKAKKRIIYAAEFKQ